MTGRDTTQDLIARAAREHKNRVRETGQDITQAILARQLPDAEVGVEYRVAWECFEDWNGRWVPDHGGSTDVLPKAALVSWVARAERQPDLWRNARIQSRTVAATPWVDGPTS